MTERGPRGDGQQDTGHLTDAELAILREQRRSAPVRGATTLVLYHPDGVRVLPLIEGEPRVIGRAPPADVALRDASLSRQHALVELLDGEVWIEDLGSTNGTWIEGERIERRATPAGTELAFGAVPAVIRDAARAETAGGPGGPAEPESHDRFEAELAREVARGRALGHTAALLMVRRRRGQAAERAAADANAAERAGAWFLRIARQLRPFDRLALYSADTVEVLLPEADAAAARALADAVVAGDRALRCGVARFPEHAGSAGELAAVARAALRQCSASTPVHEPPASGSPPASDEPDGDGPVVGCEAMQRLMATARRLAPSVIPVLLLGETGSGKEVVARVLHETGPRAGRPMICVNCGGIPEQLVESTLFGHERGAFTGATGRARGVFEAADGGTVLLDEVGELPAAAQAALLRVLETKRFSRVGTSDEIEVDVRVIAATHRDLEAMCREGRFREDLLYRLNAMTMSVPPLRERVAEIAPLVRRFVRRAAEANACPPRPVDDRALAALQRYGWPGNVRELRNAIERAVVIAVDDRIGIDDLPEPIRALRGGAGDADGPTDEATTSDELPTAGGGGVDLRAELGRVEAAMIARALREADWDRGDAARRLGLPVRTLSRKMQAHGIRRSAEAAVSDDDER